MKTTKLPDEPTPDRMGEVKLRARNKGHKQAGGLYATDIVLVETQKQMRNKQQNIQGKNKMESPGYTDISPMWDERQRALIEEFRKATRNDAR